MRNKILWGINELSQKYDTYRTRQLILFTFDMIILVLSFSISMYVNIGQSYIDSQTYLLFMGLIIITIMMKYCGCYSNLWSAGIDKEIICIFISVPLAILMNITINKFLEINLPVLFYVIFCLLNMVGLSGTRIAYRGMRRLLLYTRVNSNKDVSSKVLIIGAGGAAKLILKEMFENKQIHKFPVGIIDDDTKKQGQSIYNVPVIGSMKEINKIVENYGVEEILFSIANIDKRRKQEIIQECKKTGCNVRTIPSIQELIDGRVNINAIRDVNIEDLLGRESVEIKDIKVRKYIYNKRVLITGAGGSIGSELCRQVADLQPKEMILLDIYENNVYDIQQELIQKHGDSLNLKVLIASVRDEKRMDEIFNTYQPEVVFHAAAHKHVPLMEDSPCEAIKNNVFGTFNVAKLSSKYKVKRFVLISTDKAVNPTNIMGATKRCCEMIIQTIDKESDTEFVAVRFGNVLGSNGSVVPLFKKQIAEGGPVKVTHPEITRFFMTIPEAVSLVMEAGAIAKGGEIFVLNMGEPVKILDLAKNLITLSGFNPGEDIKIEFTGLRPGEKLYEEILMDEEGLSDTENEKIYIGKPIDVDGDFLYEKLLALKDVVEREDNERVRFVMKELVDTYVIPEEREVVYSDKITINA